MTDLTIRCHCGQFEGVAEGLRPHVVTRGICYCDDCQAFAHFLDRADDMLDPHGGTEICQVSPRTVRFIRGAERLTCVRLTPKGPYRWFTDCCRTPVANSIPGLSIVGLIGPAVKPDERLGEIRFRIFGKDAVGNRDTLDADDRVPAMAMVRILRKLALRALRGDHRHSPFHDHRTGKAAAEPTVLTAAERAQLEPVRVAWTSTRP